MQSVPNNDKTAKAANESVNETQTSAIFEQQPLIATDFKSRMQRAKILTSLEAEKNYSVTGKNEKIISNRITLRLNDLEQLPSNIGAMDVDDIDLDPDYKLRSNEDEFKIKALCELKSLSLLTKQKSLRQQMVFNLTSKALPLAEQIHLRYTNRREAEVMQLDIPTMEAMKPKRVEKEPEVELPKGNVNLKDMLEISQQFNEMLRTRKARRIRLGKLVSSAHSTIERDEQKRHERTAKQRLQALRANDEEAYIKLLDQTKDTRITHLLRQTNSFLDSLAHAVKVQQADVTTSNTEESPEEDEPEDKENIDYYQVAHRVKEEITAQPTILVGGTLKEYQLKGLQWMVSLYNNKLNGILADEMGLGKTIQSISLITYLIEVKRQPGPYLVIVPLSTMTNWNNEFDKWAPSVKKICYKGVPNVRKSFHSQIRSGDFQVLLTTFEYIIKDRPLLSKIKWVHMIIDEGHRMKNTQSKLSYTLTTYYTSQYRLILTGTPLQNNLPELWALLNFVLPKIFNSVKTFDEWFNTPFANTGGQEKISLTEEESLLVIRRLHKVLRPFLLRRLKKDVEKDLPDKVEKVIKCKMSALQTKLYDQMLEHKTLLVGESAKTGLRGLNNRIMQLRKICNHPFVFDEVENMVNPSRTNNDYLWRVAGKFELLDRVLPKFKATGHRVLMFFQMTQVMNIMEDFLRFRGMKYLRLDGATKADDRTQLLTVFNAPDSPYFAFLLSTRAGGLGLNLQTADTVIIYDTDWNPHQDLQAQDRAHRIGQTKEVRILRLITQDSVEEGILSRAHAKLEIDGKVIQAGKFDNKSTNEEQEAFLRSLLEAEEARKNQKEEDDEMDDEELNEILARTDEEAELFNKMDSERNKSSPYGKGKNLSRLISDEELPTEYTQPPPEEVPVVEEVLGRGARDRKKVYYDDGLTEDQFLEAVDQDADALDEVIKKKRERQQLREQKKRQKKENENTATPEPQTQSELEQEPKLETVTKSPSPVKPESTTNTPVESSELTSVKSKLDSKPAPAKKSEKRKRAKAEAESEAKTLTTTNGTSNGNGNSNGYTPEDDPIPKKVNTGKSSKSETATKRLQFKSTALELISELRAIKDQDGRSQSELFEELPDKTYYPDYYQLVKKPIAITTIVKRVERGVYKDFEAIRKDVELMRDNAYIYNEPSSFVCTDASALLEVAQKWFSRVTKSGSNSSSKNSSVSTKEKNGKSKSAQEKKPLPRVKIILK